MGKDRQIHIVGAGMAGLSAALQLALMDEKVALYEAAPYAGGRCRSFFDRKLGSRIDNGSHLVLSGNVAVQDYLALSGALDTMQTLDQTLFPFMDLESGDRWILRMNKGRMPWWIFDEKRRVPGTKAADYLSVLKMMRAHGDQTVASVLNATPILYRRFWEPLAVATLNTEPEIASAALLANLLSQSFSAGGRACQPMIPKEGLSESFALPCLAKLAEKGAHVRFGARLTSIAATDRKIERLVFDEGPVEVGPHDWVILAIPAWVLNDLLPEIETPNVFRGILNAHFKVEVPQNPAGFTGLIGGIAEWAFPKPQGIVSVTVSAADRYKEYPQEDWAVSIWNDLAKLYDLDPAKIPPWRIVHEKRATFAATPAQNARRPRAYCGWTNMALAGDWTDTALPSTIEGAIRSGLKAAQVAVRWSGSP